MTLPSTSVRKVAVHFVRFGPYHLARLRTAAALLAPHGWQLIGLETSAFDQTYAWRQEADPTSFERHTVFPNDAAELLPARELRRGMAAALSWLKPQAVAIAGWASPDARSCLSWCRRHGARAILMSDTRAADGQRLWLKELVKRRLLSGVDAALVAGRSHRNYLISLGMPAERIALGFDVVDNAYFRTSCVRYRTQQERTSRPYLLASNRFVPRKNLKILLKAFTAYRLSTADKLVEAWDLCLLGDGPERPDLLSLASDLGLRVHVGSPWDPDYPQDPTPKLILPGFRQIDQLPQFYARASAFIHPALSEPWGLVINEAMAAGLPILCSANVGASEELIESGLNGFCFDPLSEQEVTNAILRLTALPAEQIVSMGLASASLIEARFPLSAFGAGLKNLLSLPQRHQKS